jgi:DNA-binding MarR family transcriptional regulator
MRGRVDNDLEQDIAVFWSLIFEIVSDMEKRLFAFLEVHQLTPPQFYVLKTLFEHDGRCRIGQIAHEHHLTNATMTGLIKRLEATTPPLVVREKSADDGRSVDVILTPSGYERFWAVQNSLLAQARTVLSLLPRQERTDAMEKVRLYFQMLVQQFPLERVESDNQ